MVVAAGSKLYYGSGNAIQLYGNEWVDCGTGTGLILNGAKTIEFWLNIGENLFSSYNTSMSTTVGILGRIHTGELYGWSIYNYYAFANSLTFYQSINSLITTPNNTFTATNTWYHVALSIPAPSSTASLYVNGVLNTTGSITSNSTASPLNFYIGKVDDSILPALSSFRGQLADVRLYSAALTSAQIYANYTATESPLTGASLVGWWKCNEGGGTQTLTDSSSSGYHGTATGTSTGTGANANRLIWTPRYWTEDTQKLKLSIKHSLAGRTKTLDAWIANQRNNRESTYTLYKPVRVIDTFTNKVSFLGKTDIVEPQSDQGHQVLKIHARNYMGELFDRKMNSTYTGIALSASYRSEVIKNIINDYTYTGMVYYGTGTIETSGETGGSAVARDYLNYEKPVIQVIEDLAKEDYWTPSTWTQAGFVYSRTGAGTGDFVNNTTLADATSTSFNLVTGSGSANGLYFGANNPWAGLTFNLSATGAISGLHWEYYNNTGGWSNLSTSTSFNFSSALTGSTEWGIPTDWGTGNLWTSSGKYIVRLYADSFTSAPTTNLITQKRVAGYDYYVDDQQKFHYYRRSSKPYGGALNSGLTLYLLSGTGNYTRPILPDYSFNIQPKEVITRVTVKGTDNSGSAVSVTVNNTALAQSIGMIKERIDYVWGTGMTNAVLSAYCTDRANLLLSQQGSALQRGAASTYRFPYHTSTAATTLVNAGDLVRLNISTKSINEDFLLLEYEYNEPPATTKMKFVTNVYGRGQSPFEIQSVLEGLRGGNDIVVTYARISDLIVDSAHINSLSASKITAGTLDLTKGINVYSSASGAGVIINTGGIEGKNTAGTSTFKLNTDGSGYLGLTANEAVTWDSAGMVNIKGAYIQNASITNASIISLSADKITAGTLNLSDGITIKSNSAATANYLSMNSSGLTGFGAAGTASFYLQAGDGMAYAGAGKVILSTAGVLVECSGGAYSLFTVQNTLSYKTTIFQRNTAGGGTVGEKIGLHINCSSGDVVITSNEDIYLAPSSYYVYPAADASATAYCLGSTALRWNVQGYKVRGDNRVKIPVGPNMYD